MIRHQLFIFKCFEEDYKTPWNYAQGSKQWSKERMKGNNDFLEYKEDNENLEVETPLVLL